MFFFLINSKDRQAVEIMHRIHSVVIKYQYGRLLRHIENMRNSIDIKIDIDFDCWALHSQDPTALITISWAAIQ
jgi:hypothetical protein